MPDAPLRGGGGRSQRLDLVGEGDGLCQHPLEHLPVVVLKLGRDLSKTSKYNKRLRRLMDLKIRNATKDDCSIGILGRNVAVGSCGPAGIS